LKYSKLPSKKGLTDPEQEKNKTRWGQPGTLGCTKQERKGLLVLEKEVEILVRKCAEREKETPHWDLKKPAREAGMLGIKSFQEQAGQKTKRRDRVLAYLI